MRKIADIMGMPITVDIPECDVSRVFDLVFKRLEHIDERFSSYKQNSELSKYQRGEIKEDDVSREFKFVMTACKEASKETSGYFTAYFDGGFNPTGYVKGWAISEAGGIIEANGFKTYCIGAGGDILAKSTSNKEWSVGIQNPNHPQSILGKIIGKNFALATSGTYERGTHIINPITGEPATELLSVSVYGPEIIKVDVFATALFAEGLSGLVKLEDMKDYEALVIDQKGDFFMTSGMEKLVVF